MWQRTLQLVTVGFVAASCSQLESSNDGERTITILKGETDTRHAAVGELLEGYCTATLIGWRTALTAAHCIKDVPSYTLRVGGNTYAAASWIRHPDYDGTVAENDVAVVKLEEAPQRITRPLLGARPPEEGQAITLVGFGDTAPSGDSRLDYIRRIAYNAIGIVEPARFMYSNLAGEHGMTCAGDSGSPSFSESDGREVIVGVHSAGSRPCGLQATDMRVDHYLGWIQSQAGSDLEPDTIRPELVILGLKEGATVASSFAVELHATDVQSGLAQLSLEVDGRSAGGTSDSPAVFNLTGLALGAHTLRAVATDRAGNTTDTRLVVTVVDGSDELSAEQSAEEDESAGDEEWNEDEEAGAAEEWDGAEEWDEAEEWSEAEGWGEAEGWDGVDE